MNNTFQNKKKVTVTPSNTTTRQLVKVSRVTYGHIIAKTLVLTRKPSEMVLHSLKVFAEKNDLTITDVISPTYNVTFYDSENSNDKGFAQTLEYCQNYIAQNNGTNESYFADYKGGIVQIVCNETDEVVFETEVY